MSYTIKKEKPGHIGAFIVRNESGSYQAAFAYLREAELFVTMMGCDSCKQAVSDHTRVKGEYPPDHSIYDCDGECEDD